MLYTVIVFSRGEKTRYRFNTENEMLVFAREAVESVDGFEDGSAYVLMTRQPEPEVITNDV